MRQEKTNFFSLTSRSKETFCDFNRLSRDIEIRNQGALEEKRNKALAAKPEQGRDASGF
jgi:hypothetical protein